MSNVKAENIRDNTVVEITPALMTSIIVNAYKHNPHGVIHMTGQPGIGKTSIVYEAIELLKKTYPGFKLSYFAPGTKNQEDFNGLPSFANDDEGRTIATYSLPEWFPRDDKSRGILLLDDLSQADTSMQKSVANLCLERTLHNYKLPDGWMVVSTGNRAEDRSGVVRTLGHLSNRRTEFHVSHSYKDWEEWAIKQAMKVDENGEQNGVVVAQEIRGFLAMHEHLLCPKFDPNKDQNATPRSWMMANKWFNMLKETGQLRNQVAFITAIGGCVGQGVAQQLWAFLSHFDKLPDLDKVLADPSGYEIPTDMNIKYAMTMALFNKSNEKNIQAVLTYVNRIGTEFTAFMVKSMLGEPKKQSWFFSTKAYQDYATKNAHMFVR